MNIGGNLPTPTSNPNVGASAPQGASPAASSPLGGIGDMVTSSLPAPRLVQPSLMVGVANGSVNLLNMQVGLSTSSFSTSLESALIASDKANQSKVAENL